MGIKKPKVGEENKSWEDNIKATECNIYKKIWLKSCTLKEYSCYLLRLTFEASRTIKTKSEDLETAITCK